MPLDLGERSVYAGDPKTIILVWQDEDWTNMDFYSQIKASAGADEVLQNWTITKQVVTGSSTSTTLTLFLAGDSVYQTKDGATRKIGNAAVFDIQMVDHATQKPIETIAIGRLAVTQDITK